MVTDHFVVDKAKPGIYLEQEHKRCFHNMDMMGKCYICVSIKHL